MEMFELLYSKTHEWLGIVEGQDVAYVGISDFAIKQLTDIVYIDLPQVGDTITQGNVFGEVESVKAVGDLNAPIDGKIIEINQKALDDPSSLVNEDDPWLIKLEINYDPDVSHLLSQGQYEEQTKIF